ncbi:SLBB domain-containing protein [Treponema zuelzerae]|uniref:SLBB domain-containing protein n=1 Tax=Teretinema zuelzerae TaxID=156 RepID=A0AAE3EGH3_9SPIR|nr:SLBB domain-containing protein [Teretinema zuelzerae]MCD1653153.1 SLBB domain-containing protein [Teretinema zuelzerae]
MKKHGSTLLLLIFSSLIWAQEMNAQTRGQSSNAQEMDEGSVRIVEKNSFNPQLALSSAFYPVTPGDVYTLAYAAGTVPVTYSILVDTSFRVRVANLAVIDAAGMSFSTLKERVETIVSKNYPLSGVQFGLASPAIFRITIKGEVKKTAEQDAWALSRLSDVIEPHLTRYSSTRNVSVTSISGKTAHYDLFKATRFGDLSQNPLVRPGDVVTVNRVEREITVTGEVERPGKYQLLSGEGLKEAIEYYGSGLTPVADASRIELVRYVESSFAAGEKIFLDTKDIEANAELKNFDSISVSPISDLIPVMFMEGAVGVSDPLEVTPTPETSSRIPVRFNQGENYASLVRRYKNSFSAVSDTANAYIIREERQIPLNLNPMLYDAAYRSDYQVEKNDVLIIPFRQYFVTVSGAVQTPGRYPYIPDRDWEYYVSLAGGFNTLKNSGESVRITDVLGNKRKKTDPITPETVITARSNSFTFYFNQYAPIITTTLTAVSTFLTVLAVTGN